VIIPGVDQRADPEYVANLLSQISDELSLLVTTYSPLINKVAWGAIGAKDAVSLLKMGEDMGSA